MIHAIDFEVRHVLRAVAVIASMVTFGSAEGSAQDRTAGSTQVYEIPAQPLDAALDRYIVASGTQVLFETSIAAGRRSTEVKGQFSPEVALETLLAGTGVVALRTGADSFVIAATSDGSDAQSKRPDIGFLGALQHGVLDVLCRDARTRPGGYRAGIELWVTPTGIIEHSALIDSTGDAQRDTLLTAALQGARIGMKPPPDVPQPFLLAIAQRSPRQTGDCSG